MVFLSLLYLLPSISPSAVAHEPLSLFFLSSVLNARELKTSITIKVGASGPGRKWAEDPGAGWSVQDGGISQSWSHYPRQCPEKRRCPLRRRAQGSLPAQMDRPTPAPSLPSFQGMQPSQSEVCQAQERVSLIRASIASNSCLGTAMMRRLGFDLCLKLGWAKLHIYKID